MIYISILQFHIKNINLQTLLNCLFSEKFQVGKLMSWKMTKISMKRIVWLKSMIVDYERLLGSIIIIVTIIYVSEYLQFYYKHLPKNPTQLSRESNTA